MDLSKKGNRHSKKFQKNSKISPETKLLFSISDPDIPLTEEKNRDVQDENFIQCTKLLCKNIKKRKIDHVTLNLTFLLSRWNIAADLTKLIYSISAETENFEENFEKKIANHEIPRQHWTFLKKAGKILFNLLERCPDSKKEAKKYFQKPENKQIIEKILETLTPIAKFRNQKWEEQNSTAIRQLQAILGKGRFHFFYWQDFLKQPQEIRTLLRNRFKSELEIEAKSKNELSQLLGQIKSGRFKKKYKGITKKARFFIEICIQEYIIEESVFALWLREYDNLSCTLETHDGSLNSFTMYGINNLLHVQNKIPFIKIIDQVEIGYKIKYVYKAMSIIHDFWSWIFFSLARALKKYQPFFFTK